MARRPHKKGDRIVYDQGAIGSGKLFQARLLKVTADGNIDNGTLKQAAFLLNPSQMEESISTNWASHSVPGQSSPIYQWVHGGPRTVTFEALVTKETSYAPYDNGTTGGPLADLANSALNAVGSIASSFAGVNLPPVGDLLGLFIGDQDGQGEELSIVNYLNYYRSLCYPTYTGDGILQQSPPLVVLDFGRAVSKAFGNTKTIDPSSTVWVVTDVKITTTKFLPNLTPMEAQVSFTLVEYPIISKGVGAFGITPDSQASSADSFLNTVSDFLGL